MKFGLIREGKIPPDSRVPLTPVQCRQLIDDQRLDLVVQPFSGRCFKDGEYHALRIPLREDLTDRDVLLGVKEVPVDQLIPNKTYLFFSHTIKEQSYNRKLLQKILELNIRLIDYEVLTDGQGTRLIAFGRFAGMVGAHNSIMAFGHRSGRFALPRMLTFHDYHAAKHYYSTLVLPPFKVVLTGKGRVGHGAAQVLTDMGIRKVSPQDFLERAYPYPVFTHLGSADWVARTDDQPYDRRFFHQYPEAHRSIFLPFTQAADVFINGIYWDNRAPAFFTKAEMRRPDFRIRVIGDVTCDIAPLSSVPSTLRPSTIAAPVYGYDPVREEETAPYQKNCIDVMAVDNLPNELPRDASRAFGQQFMEHILPEFFKPVSAMLERATIAENGELGKHFHYLRSYVEQVEL